MSVVHFGSESEFICISLPSSFTTEGWAQARVDIAVNGFTAQIAPWIEASDLNLFTKQLRGVFETLQGEAEFSPVERQFTFKISAHTGGHIQVTGEAWSQATFENKLSFELQLDQSYLSQPLCDLEELMTKSISDGTTA